MPLSTSNRPSAQRELQRCCRSILECRPRAVKRARLASEAMKQTRLLVNNPCEITETDAQRLYEAAW